MKKISAAVSAIAVSLILTCASVSATEANSALPDYDSHILSETELNKFFGEENFIYDNGSQKLISKLYEKISDPSKSVYGMNFEATETYEEANSAVYGNYIADFEITSDKNMSAMLLGNYGDYGTIAMGIVNITPDKPVRVMKIFDDITGKGKLTYKEVINMVKSFNCVAIPLSSELTEAYYETKCEADSEYKESNPAYTPDVEAAILNELKTSYNPASADNFILTENNTSLTLTLKLYENDINSEDKYAETGNSWTVGNTSAFTYEKETSPEPVISTDLLLIHNMDDIDKDGVMYHPIHIYTGIDSLNCDNVGFEIKVSNDSEEETQTFSTTTVYQTMNITDNNGSKSTYNASDLNSSYMFGNELLLRADKWTNSDTTIFLTPYAVKLDGTTIKGNSITITNELIQKSNPGSSLFKTNY